MSNLSQYHKDMIDRVQSQLYGEPVKRIGKFVIRKDEVGGSYYYFLYSDESIGPLTAGTPNLLKAINHMRDHVRREQLKAI